MARNLGVPYTDEQPYYFISYNTEDEKLVSEYAKALVRLHFPLWYDSGLKVGEEFEKEIAEKIENCEAVIMFLSKNIFLKEKSYVHTEFELATEYSNKKVYVMMMDDIKKPNVPIRFRAWWTKVMQLHCINTFEHTSPDECVKLLAKNIGITSEDSPQTKEVTSSSIKKITYPNGDIYEGEFLNENRNGMGKYFFANGDVYEGEFLNGSRNGKGKYFWTNGEIYEGDFVENKITGKGIFTRKNGDVYEGDFVNSNRTGKGKLIFSNGEIYEGDFVEGKRTGSGKYFWPSGSIYEGDFIDDKRTGTGKFIWPNGNIYVGKFSDGEQTGLGAYIWSNGAVYVGDFVDGIRTGKGKLIQANKKIFEGYFKDGKFIG